MQVKEPSWATIDPNVLDGKDVLSNCHFLRINNEDVGVGDLSLPDYSFFFNVGPYEMNDWDKNV